MGWPLGNSTGGGSFLYHFGDVSFRSASSSTSTTTIRIFRRLRNSSGSKRIRWSRDTFADGKRICYGARAITEGGWQSVPKLVFPGGALVGCAAGFMNVPRIKGSHNAMLSGMLAAENVAAALEAGRSHDELTTTMRHGAARR